MNYIKNIILFFGSILLSFFLVYLIVLFWVSINEKYISDNNFTNKEELNFHRNYSNKVHHLRGKHFIKENIKKEEYFFTEVSKYSKNKINFLIQGDSWAEYLSTKNLSKKKLNEIAKINKIGLINAGIASFSPSPMTVQFQILKDDFNISPSVVIAIIDQTDIGDELCRYRSKIKFDKYKKKMFIEREKNTGAIFDYSKYYNFSEIIFKKSNFEKIYITNYYFKKFYHENVYKFKNRNIKSSKCTFKDIQKYLFKLDDDDENYFISVLNAYISKVLGSKNNIKLYIISHPHRKHLNNKYNVNISDIIDKLELPKNAYHINYTKIIDKNTNLTIFEKDDPASHLSDNSQSLFIENIFNSILN
ncbi:hypothetical protein JI56_02310 [SAR11 cluster bacterium PRT-SC02]|nr:hypothetical protein JI56_02310 [SAR11 cluster bacterium PRT-SC02]